MRPGAVGPGGRPSPRQLAEVAKLVEELEHEAEAGDAPPANVAPESARRRAEQHERNGDAEPAAPLPPPGYADLGAQEVIALLSSLGDGDLRSLRAHEELGPARDEVLAAIDRYLAGKGSTA